MAGRPHPVGPVRAQAGRAGAAREPGGGLRGGRRPAAGSRRLGPTPAFRQLAWISLFAALLALGVTALRRQTAVEFAGVQRGDAIRELRERRETVRARKSAAGACAASPMVPAGPAPAAPSQSIDDLERLVALHDSGQLSDTEFATAKTRVMNGS